MSLAALVWRTSKGEVSELGMTRGRLAFEPVAPTPAAGSETMSIRRLLIFAPEESLFFANADTIRTEITNRLAARAEQETAADASGAAGKVERVLLDLELTNELDVPSADMLEELHADLHASGVGLSLARVRPAVRDLLNRSGVTDKIGAEHIHGRVLEGVLLHLCASEGQADSLLGLSGAALRALEQVVSEMLPRAQGEQQVQLGALRARLARAISALPAETEPK
jgi:MFS superfamily sulfate permease-like transporter